ncbi:REP element-mobilizing transposase RayT [Algisphaera agarilytica]|uniref:REP element-mobilizing transposase RayT n=1 Tax=Algisphaera agarilytica TaxID=1385975 RepID=A0A7X0LKK5_9BACT|nr:REP element-mobilizing transposase RayT [Algisphaera agarilytica]
MPCYLFTWHTYGSWMPDRPRGYVRRDHDGVMPTDETAAAAYRERMSGAAVIWSPEQQALILETLRNATEPLAYRLHAVAVDPTHVHALLSWNDDRDWKGLRSSARHSMTRKLNSTFGKRDWMSRGGSGKRVKDQAHFERLVAGYLPGHHALFWKEGDDKL